MADKITIVSPPDDMYDDGFKVLFVDLDRSQEEIVSRSMITTDSDSPIIAYTWNYGADINWLLDKKTKANLIIFNAVSINQTIVGYMAAQPNSFYFSDLRDLNSSADKKIHDPANCGEIFLNYIGKYERSFK